MSEINKMVLVSGICRLGFPRLREVTVITDSVTHQLPYAAFPLISYIWRNDPILLEVAEEEFNEEDEPYSYQDKFEPDIMEPESDPAEDTVGTKDGLSELKCYAIISEVNEPNNVSTVNDEPKILHEQYQTQIQKSDIIQLLGQKK